MLNTEVIRTAVLNTDQSCARHPVFGFRTPVDRVSPYDPAEMELHRIFLLDHANGVCSLITHAAHTMGSMSLVVVVVVVVVLMPEF